MVTILFYLALGLIVCNLVYLFSFISLSKYKSPQPPAADIPVSVIVCAKNEQDHLDLLLPKLLEQFYTQFEIIAINDCSTDDTRDVIEKYVAQDNRLQLVNVVPNEAFWGNKKYALTLGIKKAKFEHLLFIDADCVPASKNWISSMAGSFTDAKSLVLGYGAYRKEKGILNTIIRYETGMTAIQYLNYAINGSPYMGVGRNLGYASELFYQARGFQNHLHILGGDDDLFVNQVARSSNTSIQIDPGSFTLSTPEGTWKDWWRQKRRHINTAAHYRTKHKLMLGLYYLSQVMVYASFFVLPFLVAPQLWILAAALGFRFLVMWLVIGFGFKKLKETGLIALIPVLEIALLISQLGLLINNLISKPSKW